MKNLVIHKFIVICLSGFLGNAWTQPNIVWIMAEDIGPDLSGYGVKGIQTPNIDRIGNDGIRLTRAYTNNPICSPARSSMITGMHQNVIDAHNHRSHRGDGYNLPGDVTTLTYLLREAGYYTSNGNGYNAKTDVNFNLTSAESPLFNSNDWSGRAPDQPFFAQISLPVTHRNTSINGWQNNRSNSSDPVDPDEIDIPPYLPDIPEVREDWALYLDQMEVADNQVGAIIQRLEDENILDNTMLIFIGDNGRCQIRGKGYLYEDGVLVPAVIRWPGVITPGTVSDELVPMIDMVAQILVAAGVDVPDWMMGRPFLEQGIPDREYVFVARDRWDEVMDKSRGIIGPRYKLIRNDLFLVPYDANQMYLNNSGVRPLVPVLRDYFAAGSMNAIESVFWEPEKPPLQLFDLQEDPWETVNLVDSPEHQAIVADLRQKLRDWEIREGDMGRIPEQPSALTGNFAGWFDDNEYMQNIIQEHPVTVNGTANGNVILTYAGLQQLPVNKNARYGFEIGMQAVPNDGYALTGVTSPDVDVIYDAQTGYAYFYMPLEPVSIDLEFSTAVPGCMDSDYAEYNPTANLHDEGACITGIHFKGPVDELFKIQRNTLEFRANRTWSISLFNVGGKLIYQKKFAGAEQLFFQGLVEPGIYFMQIVSGPLKFRQKTAIF